MTISEQLDVLSRRIEYRLQRIGEHQEQVDAMRKQKAALYQDSGLEPLWGMTNAERKAIMDMPRAENKCEYCNKDEVRIGGKRRICISCGHENGKIE